MAHKDLKKFTVLENISLHAVVEAASEEEAVARFETLCESFEVDIVRERWAVELQKLELKCSMRME